MPVVFLCLSVSVQAQPEYWQKQYRTDFSAEYFFKDIIIDNKGNYIAAGYTDDISRFSNFLVYVNKFGVPLWKKIINDQYNIYAQKIIVADTSSFIVACKYVLDTVTLYRIDNIGNILWEKKFSELGFVKDAIKTPDNKFIISGGSASYPFLLKIDIEGNEIFKKRYEYNFVNSYYQIATKDKFIIAGGLSRNGSGAPNIFFLRKLDSLGNIILNSTFSLNQSFTVANFLYDTTNIYLIGKKSTGQGIYKFDYNFSLLDSVNIESGINEYFISANFVNKNFIICCSKDNVNVLFKLTNPNGMILKQKIIYPNQGGVINPYNIYFDKINNSYYSSGYSDFYGEKIAFGYIVKLDSNLITTLAPIGIKNENSIVKDFQLSQNYPNPFNPSTKISYSLKKSSSIELKLFDINGRLIKIIESGFKPAGFSEINFSAEGLSSGVYFFSLYSEGILMDTKKGVILK